MEEETEESKGLHFRLLGVVMIFLGSLDLLLCWRGGLEVNYIYVVLLVVGIFLFAIGHIGSGDSNKS